jgi:hypothetical protein
VSFSYPRTIIAIRTSNLIKHTPWDEVCEIFFPNFEVRTGEKHGLFKEPSSILEYGTNLYGVISQKARISVTTAAKTSNLALSPRLHQPPITDRARQTMALPCCVKQVGQHPFNHCKLICIDVFPVMLRATNESQHMNIFLLSSYAKQGQLYR